MCWLISHSYFVPPLSRQLGVKRMSSSVSLSWNQHPTMVASIVRWGKTTWRRVDTNTEEQVRWGFNSDGRGALILIATELDLWCSDESLVEIVAVDVIGGWSPPIFVCWNLEMRQRRLVKIRKGDWGIGENKWNDMWWKGLQFSPLLNCTFYTSSRSN